LDRFQDQRRAVLTNPEFLAGQRPLLALIHEHINLLGAATICSGVSFLLGISLFSFCLPIFQSDWCRNPRSDQWR
jgi:hypothetical protein